MRHQPPHPFVTLVGIIHGFEYYFNELVPETNEQLKGMRLWTWSVFFTCSGLFTCSGAPPCLCARPRQSPQSSSGQYLALQTPYLQYHISISAICSGFMPVSAFPAKCRNSQRFEADGISVTNNTKLIWSDKYTSLTKRHIYNIFVKNYASSLIS